jgi:hypothetical protein
MDRGPIRTPRSSGGGMINSRPDVPAATPPYKATDEEPQPTVATPQPKAEVVPESVVHHRRTPTITEAIREDKKPRGPRRKKRLLIIIIAIVVVIGLAIGGYVAWQNKQNATTGINSSEYQAVFFTNGQVYFGKLQSFNSQYLKLTDIFYLQTQSTDSTNPQETSTDTSSNVQLIKLGNEINGPEDEMIIARDQVLFYENLKSSGKVATSIAQYQKSN